MKPDRLEEYIRNNRDAFDDLAPDPEIWNRIVRQDTKPGVLRLNWKGIAWKAAAVLIIFIVSYFFHDYMSNRDESDDIAEMKRSEKMIRTMLQEAETYYTSQIQIKEQEIYRVAPSHQDIREEITTEFSDLDKIYEELKKDLKDNADNEEVIEAMIQNYRIKLQILEDILYQLQRSNATGEVQTKEM